MGTVVQVKRFETPAKTRQMIVDEVRRDFEEWLSAKEDLIWRPPIQLREKDNEFELTAVVAGVDPGKVEVLVASDIMLIKAGMRGENSSESGIFHRREFEPRKLSRSVIFPRSVDPENVRAEMKDGLLTVKARIAGAAHIVDFMPVAA